MLANLLFVRYNLRRKQPMIRNMNSNYTSLERFNSYPDYSDNRLYSGASRPLFAQRHRATEREVTTSDKVKAGVGAVLGTILPMAYMMKKQNVRNPFKLTYGLKEIITMSAGSIAGGVAVGMIGENRKTNENKMKEGLFQFLNASIPTWIVAGVLKLCESSKNFNNLPGKIMSVAGGLIVGMYGAASVSNLICDPHDKKPDRKLTLKDCLINIDDALGVLVLAKFPLADKLHVEKLLPFIFAYCGYRAGKSN